MSWNEGYVSDSLYTQGYYPEFNPVRLPLVLALSGFSAPPEGPCCELGFGMGLSLGVHAAGCRDRDWWGTDFNPTQVAHARRMDRESQSCARIFDQSFGEFCSRDDLPDFAVIVLHGIWTWISDNNRQIIVDFLRRKLKVGGVLYISYNTTPGWASMIPVRNLMAEHAKRLGRVEQGSLVQAREALAFVKKLFELEPLYARFHPNLRDRLAKLEKQNSSYIAHEYLNNAWKPMDFSEMTDWLEPAKLSYACSALLTDSIDILNLSEAQQSFLKDLPSGIFRETVRDIMVNQQFRRDLWVRGPRSLRKHETAQNVLQASVALTVPPSRIPAQIHGARTQTSLKQELISAMVGCFPPDFAPRPVKVLEQYAAKAGVSGPIFAQTLRMLMSVGVLQPAQCQDAVAHSVESAHRFNAWILGECLTGGAITTLVSPVTGAGLKLNRTSIYMLDGRRKGCTTAEQLADHAMNIMFALGEKIMKDGQPVFDREAMRSELMRDAKELLENSVPVLDALRILPKENAGLDLNS